MLIALEILISGLLASYLFLHLVYPDREMIKLIGSTITLFICSTIVFWYYFDRFGILRLSLAIVSVLPQIAAFLVKGMLLSAQNPLSSGEKAAKNFTLGFLISSVVLSKFYGGDGSGANQLL